MLRKLMVSGLTICLLTGLAGAAEPLPSGEKLFNDPNLGSNGKSCATCHDQGKGLELAGDYDEMMLREYMNFCIRDALKGTPLPLDDPRVIALERYVRGLYNK